VRSPTENVHMHDAPDGGGNRATAGARREVKQSRAGLTLNPKKQKRRST
jgi:hypothetical protein